MTTAFTVRTATAEDIPRLMEIRAAVRENRLRDPSRVVLGDYVWFIANSDVWVADFGDRLVGFSAGDPRDGTIWALFVDPSYEGHGIGRALIARACSSLRSAGFAAVSLSTGRGTRAERFYRLNGWTEMGLTSGGEVAFQRGLEP